MRIPLIEENPIVHNFVLAKTVSLTYRVPALGGDGTHTDHFNLVASERINLSHTCRTLHRSLR
jgi:hypothetical protein